MIRLAIQSIHEANQAICGHEVLARKVLEGDRVAAPGIFMANSSDEDWVALDLSVYRLVADSDLLMKDPWPLFINMSPPTIDADGHFLKALKLMEVIARSRAAATVVEVSEESEISGSKLDLRLKAFRNIGLRVAMDDFGVGHSNIERLTRHAWSYCKIDLYSLAEAQNLDWLIEAKVTCDERRIGIVLERFESHQSKDLLQPFRNSLYQGYAFSRPKLLNEVATPRSLSKVLG